MKRFRAKRMKLDVEPLVHLRLTLEVCKAHQLPEYFLLLRLVLFRDIEVA